MTDQALSILKLVLLGLLYLFFARVLWAVWSEVRRSSTAAKTTAPITADEEQDATAIPAVAAPISRREQRRERRTAKRAPARQVAHLAVIEPKSKRGRTYALGSEVTIGRDPSSTIAIGDDSFISQHHARIYDVQGQTMVEDLGSTNGSFHNGNRLIGARLVHPGDRMQFGHTVLEAQ